MNITRTNGKDNGQFMVEYTLYIPEAENRGYCNKDNNTITLRLYSFRDEKGGVLHYNAGVGFSNRDHVQNIGIDSKPCPNEIVVGIDKNNYNNTYYITELILQLLHENYFEKGVYKQGNDEMPKGGNYVGELIPKIVENRAQTFQIRIDPDYAATVHDEYCQQQAYDAEMSRLARETQKVLWKTYGEYYQAANRLSEKYPNAIKRRYTMGDLSSTREIPLEGQKASASPEKSSVPTERE